LLVVTRNNAFEQRSSGRSIQALVHDARNPLNAISVALEVLTERMKRDGGGQLDGAYARCLGLMRDNIARMDGVLQCIEAIRPHGRERQEGRCP
jgi:signal transduction histidine kinase